MTASRLVAAALVLASGCAPAQAQQAMSPKEAAHAAEIRETLKRIRMPPGFSISLYALVPEARHMAVGPEGRRVFVGTTEREAYVATDSNSDGIADDVRRFAPDLEFVMPNGPCFAPDGTLFIAEQNRIRAFPKAEADPEAAAARAVDVVPAGELIPRSEQSRGHSARVCRVGPDGKLYVSLGQPYNVSPPGKLAMYDKLGIGGIIRLNQDGSGREVYTLGLRNSVGHDFHPMTGELWFTDNQVDEMGDEIPPGELNRQTAPGQHFGFPWHGGGSIRVTEHGYDKTTPPPNVVMPAVETVAHAADLGMTFYTGAMFPAAYKNAIFSAQHGSWNRSTPVGARVMATFLDEKGAARMEPFAEGWIDADGSYLGRPVDVAQLKDGSILVSDDLMGAIYRISWKAP